MVSAEQYCFVFDAIGIDNDALHRADFDALRFFEMPNAFGATRWSNFVDFLALINGIVWAFGLTYITVEAFVCDQQRHEQRLPR